MEQNTKVEKTSQLSNNSLVWLVPNIYTLLADTLWKNMIKRLYFIYSVYQDLTISRHIPRSNEITLSINTWKIRRHYHALLMLCTSHSVMFDRKSNITAIIKLLNIRISNFKDSTLVKNHFCLSIAFLMDIFIWYWPTITRRIAIMNILHIHQLYWLMILKPIYQYAKNKDKDKDKDKNKMEVITANSPMHNSYWIQYSIHVY